MKVKDLEKIFCTDCPFRREGYCTQPDDPLCADLDENTDVDNWLAEAEEIQHQYELRLERQAQKEREIQAEKERKRKLRKEREAYCKEEIKKLSHCRRIYKKILQQKETMERFVCATNKTNEQLGDETRIEVNQAFITNCEMAKWEFEFAEYRYKEKLKEFKKQRRRLNYDERKDN